MVTMQVVQLFQEKDIDHVVEDLRDFGKIYMVTMLVAELFQENDIDHFVEDL